MRLNSSSNVLEPVAPVPPFLTLDFTSAPAAVISRLERARAANFRHKLDASGGRAARLPEGHVAVVHGADQRREMRAARNRDGCAASGPVACKRYRVCCCGLRTGRLRLHAEGDDGKEKNTYRSPSRDRKKRGRGVENRRVPTYGYRPGTPRRTGPVVCLTLIRPFQIK